MLRGGRHQRPQGFRGPALPADDLAHVARGDAQLHDRHAAVRRLGDLHRLGLIDERAHGDLHGRRIGLAMAIRRAPALARHPRQPLAQRRLTAVRLSDGAAGRGAGAAGATSTAGAPPAGAARATCAPCRTAARPSTASSPRARGRPRPSRASPAGSSPEDLDEAAVAGGLRSGHHQPEERPLLRSHPTHPNCQHVAPCTLVRLSRRD